MKILKYWILNYPDNYYITIQTFPILLGMWPLRVGPLNTLNGMRDSELPSTASADSSNGKRLLDNTLVMSFVEHTIVLTLTGEEVNLLYLKTKTPDRIIIALVFVAHL